MPLRGPEKAQEVALAISEYPPRSPKEPALGSGPIMIISVAVHGWTPLKTVKRLLSSPLSL